MEFGNEEQFLSEIIDKTTKDDGIKDTHNLIQIFKDVYYFNENHIHFIGKLEYKNYTVNFNYGFMFIEHPEYIIKLMGYFDGLYFYGTQHIIYKYQNLLKEMIYTGYMKYDKFKRYYERNGYGILIKKYINNSETQIECDLFKTDFNRHKNFYYYKNNKCEECQLNNCNILYLEKKSYICIHCDRKNDDKEHDTRYYFENDKGIVNNRILIDNDSSVYNIDGEIFTKNSHGSIKKIRLKTIKDIKKYTRIEPVIKFIINRIDFTQLNKEYINKYIEIHYGELNSKFSKYF